MTKKKPKSNKLTRKTEDIKKVKIEVPDGNSFEMRRKRRFFHWGKKFVKLSWWDRRILARHPDKTYIIHMMFANGTSKIFVIKTKGYSFLMRKKTYFLYYEESWYNITLNQYELFYHENYVMPINREIQQKGNEAYFNVTPENAKEIIDFEYVKVLAGSNNISNSMKFILILCIINLIASAIILLLMFNAGKGG